MPHREFGFNVVGNVSANVGLGVSARHIVQSLLDAGFEVAIHDLDPGYGRAGHDLRFQNLFVTEARDLPYSINLFVLPPQTLAVVLAQRPKFWSDPERLNVALTFWELPAVPRHLRAALEFFDAVIAPSAFIRHTLDVALDSTLTISARQPLYLPGDVRPDRSRFEIGAEELVFVTSFEPLSGVARKNPGAVIDAFQKALPDRPDARLLIRLNNSAPTGASEALRRACAGDRRIRLLTEPLTYSAVLSLYASSDVFVSLHRSEGLGLGLMEAMALGKPCIATAWSGNMDFMDHTNAALVPYRLVPVVADVEPYAFATNSVKWAEPDVEAAAAWMRRFAGDRDLRSSLGGRAAASMATHQAEAAKVRFAYEVKSLAEHRGHVDQTRNRSRRIDAAFKAVIAGKPAPARAMATVGRAALRSLDRHVLWRFRNS